jgi:hypothetical protein
MEPIQTDCMLHLSCLHPVISIMDEVVDTQLRLQRATGTIADQKRHIATRKLQSHCFCGIS